jgi:hypothetical protein
MIFANIKEYLVDPHWHHHLFFIVDRSQIERPMSHFRGSCDARMRTDKDPLDNGLSLIPAMEA